MITQEITDTRLRDRIAELEDELATEKARTGLKFYVWDSCDYKCSAHADSVWQARDLVLAELDSSDPIWQAARKFVLLSMPEIYRGPGALVAIVGNEAVKERDADLAIQDETIARLNREIAELKKWKAA